MSLLRKLLLITTSALVIFYGLTANAFVVQNIKIEGAQRVPAATVVAYMPVKVGQEVNETDSTRIIDALYKTGFFSDVSLLREGNTLIVKVLERSVIGTVDISGNKLVKTEQLKDALKGAGISEGEVYNKASLAAVEQALKQQYYNLGRYNASIDTTITPELRNRVKLAIRISEGQVAQVKQINIIGNKAFSEKELLNNFELTTHHFWSFITHGDQYSKEKLDADLESLRSYYLDRGYLKFKIDNTQVSITPDRAHIYINVHITEGPIYKFSGYKLAGNLLGKGAEVASLVDIHAGEPFSRKKVVDTQTSIAKYYANMGYALATVNVVPAIDENNRQITVELIVNPAQLVYVRNVSFSGNTKTQDYVLRREVRQMEGGVYSLRNIDESKRRLNNLGYLENIESHVTPVPGHPNQVDLNYSLKEHSSAAFNAQLGYSDTFGLLLGASVTESNFLGTGKGISLAFNRSQFSQNYNLTYLDPYYTPSGISRSISLYYQRVTADAINLATYVTNTYGFLINYGIPLSEYDYLTAGYGYENTQVRLGNPSPEPEQTFLTQHGSRFNNFKITLGWQHSNFDRKLFPTKGFSQGINIEGGIPLTSNAVQYYKIGYSAGWYQPLPIKGFIVHATTNLGYGNGYGSFQQLPFFYNYYAGGIGTVRGYQGNTLGPQDSSSNPIGGNVLETASMAVILPSFISDSVRTSLFVDVGNVFTKVTLNDLRYSAGVSVEWLSPLGPLQFSVAKAINPGDTDQTQFFQFSIASGL